MSEFRAMRRKRQQLSEEESVAILKKATAGTLALLGDNDYPYAVPLSYVYQEGRIYFHSALAGHKVDAIRKCDKASFCVIEQDDVQPEKYLEMPGHLAAPADGAVVRHRHDEVLLHHTATGALMAGQGS